MSHENPTPAVMFGPGRILRDELDAREITQEDFATAIGRSRQFVNGLIGGTRPLTFEVAILLEAALGIDAELWLKMQHNFRRHQEAKGIQQLQLGVRKRVIAMPDEVTQAFMSATKKAKHSTDPKSTNVRSRVKTDGAKKARAAKSTAASALSQKRKRKK